ncbi:MAG: ABC transporter ATP-binding protein [Negativicutes bacterium]|nr:ABC transporter ATP-binding protein [Negativicutes bacterium]
MMDQDSCMLDIQAISKSFGGLQALEGVSVQVAPGTIHGIIGPNGAGKTTLFNIITGLIGPDKGRVAIQGTTVPFERPDKLVPLGIARTFQNIRLFKSLSVLENVLVGQHVHTPTPIFSIIVNGPTSRHWEKVAQEESRAALRFVGLEDKAGEIVKNLSYGQQRLVEFARALAAKPKVLLLDEPAAGMNPTEKTHLVKIVAALKAQGYTVILIEHDMKLVMNICSTITVLDHGKKIAEGPPEHVRKHPDVISAYLGRGEHGHAGS